MIVRIFINSEPEIKQFHIAIAHCNIFRLDVPVNPDGMKEFYSHNELIHENIKYICDF